MELWGGDCACAASLPAHLQVMTTRGSQHAGKWTSSVFLRCNNVQFLHIGNKSAFLPFVESICRRNSRVVLVDLMRNQDEGQFTHFTNKSQNCHNSLVPCHQHGYKYGCGMGPYFSTNISLKYASIAVLVTSPSWSIRHTTGSIERIE